MHQFSCSYHRGGGLGSIHFPDSIWGRMENGILIAHRGMDKDQEIDEVNMHIAVEPCNVGGRTGTGRMRPRFPPPYHLLRARFPTTGRRHPAVGQWRG